MVAGFGAIWVGVPNIASVVRIDAVTNKVLATIPVPDPAYPCGGMAVTSDAVWVAGCGATNSVARIDPQTNATVTTIDLGANNEEPVIVDDTPWFPTWGLNGAPGALVQIDPATNQVASELGILPGLLGYGAVIANNSVWVVDGSSGGQIVRVPLSALKAP
ncbi:MAG: DUF6923 family protein, partial [Candidatus Limnocylindrales bacterium]